MPGSLVLFVGFLKEGGETGASRPQEPAGLHGATELFMGFRQKKVNQLLLSRELGSLADHEYSCGPGQPLVQW